jgi:hypothetical protein
MVMVVGTFPDLDFILTRGCDSYGHFRLRNFTKREMNDN